MLCGAVLLQVMELVEGNRVLEHILMRNKVLDGDNYVLHVQVGLQVVVLVGGCMLASTCCMQTAKS